MFRNSIEQDANEQEKQKIIDLCDKQQLQYWWEPKIFEQPSGDPTFKSAVSNVYDYMCNVLDKVKLHTNKSIEKLFIGKTSIPTDPHRQWDSNIKSRYYYHTKESHGKHGMVIVTKVTHEVAAMVHYEGSTEDCALAIKRELQDRFQSKSYGTLVRNKSSGRKAPNAKSYPLFFTLTLTYLTSSALSEIKKLCSGKCEQVYGLHSLEAQLESGDPKSKAISIVYEHMCAILSEIQVRTGKRIREFFIGKTYIPKTADFDSNNHTTWDKSVIERRFKQKRKERKSYAEFGMVVTTIITSEVAKIVGYEGKTQTCAIDIRKGVQDRFKQDQKTNKKYGTLRPYNAHGAYATNAIAYPLYITCSLAN